MSQEPNGEDPPPSYDEVMRGNMIDDQDLMTETISAPPEYELVAIPEDNVGNDETQQNVNAKERMRRYCKLVLQFLLKFVRFIWCSLCVIIMFCVMISLPVLAVLTLVHRFGYGFRKQG